MWYENSSFIIAGLRIVLSLLIVEESDNMCSLSDQILRQTDLMMTIFWTLVISRCLVAAMCAYITARYAREKNTSRLQLLSSVADCWLPVWSEVTGTSMLASTWHLNTHTDMAIQSNLVRLVANYILRNSTSKQVKPSTILVFHVYATVGITLPIHP